MQAATELRFEGVSAGYAGARVLHGVDFTLRQGRKLGLIGRNGAWPTTLASAVGHAQLQGGRVLLDGRDASAWPTHARARAGLGYVPQGREIFPSLSVEENLIAALQGHPRGPALDKVYGLFPRLRERRRNGGTQLSGGEQQMLSVARALMAGPSLLLLDEPLEGLAPKVRDELMDAISALVASTGVGCLLVEQHVDVVLDFADEVIVLERGVPVFHGPVEELRSDGAILDRAIGLEKV
jgi:branched-chain amino acid transport system ATP-binding protein